MSVKREFIALLFLCASCTSDNESNMVENPAAPGFDYENSDPAGIELADSVMAAMGGRRNWDDTRFISWKFSSRNLVWDKQTGRVRIETGDSTIYLININTGEGRVQIKGEEILQEDQLKTKLKEAKNYWINDSYWLVMPFKLKDTGVTLKYLGEETVGDSSRYNLLEITFNDVGNTPQNKYLLYIDIRDNLVKQWAYYREADQDSASFVLPWDNYKNYGNILLSADRTGGRGPRSVSVDRQISDSVFVNF